MKYCWIALALWLLLGGCVAKTIAPAPVSSAPAFCAPTETASMPAAPAEQVQKLELTMEDLSVSAVLPGGWVCEAFVDHIEVNGLKVLRCWTGEDRSAAALLFLRPEPYIWEDTLGYVLAQRSFAGAGEATVFTSEDGSCIWHVFFATGNRRVHVTWEGTREQYQTHQIGFLELADSVIIQTP